MTDTNRAEPMKRQWRIEQRDDQKPFGKAMLVVTGCPKGECRIALWQLPATDNGNTKRWHWDGSVTHPTIRPSVNCNGEGGCGWHVTFTNGVPE